MKKKKTILLVENHIITNYIKIYKYNLRIQGTFTLPSL